MPIRMREPRNPSGHIHSFGFDEDTGTLAVRFQRGGTYYYPGVSRETFGQLCNAQSAGEFFCSNIKGKISHLTKRP